jgi:hypothetical protein
MSIESAAGNDLIEDSARFIRATGIEFDAVPSLPRTG